MPLASRQEAMETPDMLPSRQDNAAPFHTSINLCPRVSQHALPEQLMQALLTRSSQPVFYFQNYAISGSSLLVRVQRLSQALRENGITADSRVGVALPRSPDVLVVMLALWHCEAVYVPLDASQPEERLLTLHNAVAFTHLVVAPCNQELLSILPVTQLVLPAMRYGDNSTAIPVSSPYTGLSLNQTACILFTSGSTGHPKAVGITHGNLATLMHSILTRLPLPSPFVLLGCANFCFDISLFELLAPILANGSLVLADDESYRNPERLLSMIQSMQINVVQATPSLWRLLLKMAPASSLSLALALSTGEALEKQLAGAILTHSRQLWNLYGPTECTLWACEHEVNSDDLEKEAPDIITIGHALPGYTVNLISEPDPLFDTGELIIQGPGVAPGYIHGTAEQQACFSSPNQQRPYWQYRTGDRCARNARNGYHFLGRLDSQVKYNGYRIDLEEIAGYLRKHNSVADACCLLKSRTGLGDQLIAFVLWRPGEPNKNHQQLRAHLARWLPEWMLPQRYIPLTTWPLGPQGKIDHSTLFKLTEPVRIAPRKPEPLPIPEGGANSGSADSTLVVEVARIFCEVLELDAISPADNFFDMGGNSMLAASLVMSLNEQLNVSLGFREVLRSPPTVLQIVQLLHTQSPAT